MSTLKVEDILSEGELDPNDLIKKVLDSGKEFGYGSRVSYDLACWFAAKADRLGKCAASPRKRRRAEVDGLGELRVAVESGHYVKDWARKDPTLAPFRDGPNEETRNEFWAIVGKPDAEAGDLAGLECVGPAWSHVLESLKIATVSDLKSAVASADDRKDLSARLDAPAELVNAWYQALQIYEIVGGTTIVNILGRGGVFTVEQLAKADAGHLAARLKRLNESPKLLIEDPEETDVEVWIAGAKAAKPSPRGVSRGVRPGPPRS